MVKKEDIELLSVRIVGDTPLIYREWGGHSGPCGCQGHRKPVFATALGRLIYEAETGGQLTLPDADENTKYEFPSGGIRAAMVAACVASDCVPKVQARQAFRMAEQYVEIKGTAKLRQDMVKIGMRIADTRYRAEFNPWYIDLEILYNSKVITPDQLIKILHIAGFAVGIGEWRPERDGQNGQFHTENATHTRRESEVGQEISIS